VSFSGTLYDKVWESAGKGGGGRRGGLGGARGLSCPGGATSCYRLHLITGDQFPGLRGLPGAGLGGAHPERTVATWNHMCPIPPGAPFADPLAETMLATLESTARSTGIRPFTGHRPAAVRGIGT